MSSRMALLGLLIGMTAATIMVAGCEGDSGSTATVVDSAGVRITTSPDGGATYGVVSEEPLVSLGGPDAVGVTQFFQVQGIRIDPRNRLWVADGQSGELRIFDLEGRHQATRGGTGDGPGEFRSIRMLGAFGGDSVAMGDRAGDRITVFDPAGDLARVARLAPAQDQVALPHRVFEDGTVLAQVPRLFAFGSLGPGRIIVDTARLVRIGPDEQVARVAEVAGPLWLWTGSNQIPIPFTTNPGMAVVGRSVHLVSGPRFLIDRFEDGRLAERYGVDRPPRPVQQTDIDGYRAMAEQYVDARQRPEFLSGLDHEARPDLLPAYTRLLVDDLGNVWAQWYSPDTVWDVFAPTRELLGQIRVPESFWLMDVRGEVLAGVWRDEQTVEHVRVYRLEAR